MRLVFCGSGGFGVPTLRALAAGGHDVALVVTQPPRPAGRGGRLTPTPLSTVARELHLSVTAVEDVNAAENVAAIAHAAPEVVLVADFGQKIGPEVRAAAPHGAVNLHGSLLPELRGAAPVNWAIIRGFARTGVTVFRIVERMDAGPVFCRKATAISPDETAEELRARLAELGVRAVLETLDALAAGPCQGQEQDESLATRAPRLKKSDGAIDFSADAVTVRNLIHGTWPWPGGQAVYVAPGGKATAVVIARARAADVERPHARPGAIGEDLTVACGRGSLEILQIKPAGRRLIHWRDFVNGYRVSPAASFIGVGR